jgi:Trk K+ transport system NAD-binding subunit
MHKVDSGAVKTSVIIKDFSLKIFILFIIYFILSKFILPRLSKIFANSQELLLLFSAAFSFSYAYLFYTFGFSLEIGALLAGIVLSTSSFSKEIASRFRPIRDFFLIIFFIILGVEAQFNNLQNSGLLITLLSIFVIIINPLILFLIMNLLGHRTRTSFYTSVTMGQVSEFSLVILSIARGYGYINDTSFAMVLVVMLISICFSSYMILYSEKIYNFIKPFLRIIEIRKNNNRIIEKEENIFDFVVFGYDRVGKRFLDLAIEKGYNYVIIDINPKSVEKAQKEGGNAFYGDAGDLGFLEENNLLKSKMIVSTIPDFNTNLNLIYFYKGANKNSKDDEKIIIVVAHREDQARELYKHGADYVIMPYQIGANEAAHFIKNFDFEKEKFILEKKKHLQILKNY